MKAMIYLSKILNTKKNSMQSAEIKVIVIKTDSGKIRIKFPDGSCYPIPDTMENIGIISSFEVELNYALKNKSNG